jgi:hypothetical protein
MIGKTGNHILLLFDLAPNIDNLGLQILIGHFHNLAFGGSPIGFPLLVMCGQLILLNEL